MVQFHKLEGETENTVMSFQVVVSIKTRAYGKDRKRGRTLDGENLELTTKNPSKDKTCAEETVNGIHQRCTAII